MNVLHISSAVAETVVPAIVPASKMAAAKGAKPRVFHRIHEVRVQQGVSLRTAARHLETDIRTARNQEEESNDLRLSELYKWQKVLDVPVTELLTESEDPLSRPVLERARMVRIMKTAQALLEKAPTPPVKRMAQMLVEQLTEVMPELASVSPWHSVGQRRSLEDLGRVAEHTISIDSLGE
jgi:transcriptional regulator with XRE-family HTH domain